MADIAVEVVVCGELQYSEGCVRSHEWRIERKAQLKEEARKRKVEAERKERERLARLERERVDRLLGEARSLRQANDIRNYVDAVRTATGQSGQLSQEELERWCTWALAQADRIDPIRNLKFLNLSAREAGDEGTSTL